MARVLPIALGLRANAGQFALLVGVQTLIGAMVGQERTVLPLMATRIFGLEGVASVLTFLVAFGITKALTNLAAGLLADRFGRHPVLVAGWLIGVPVPVLLIWAPSWEWVVAANVLLGINQGLTWSVAVMMKVDLVGPRRRGLALGLNEAAGYSSVAVTALVTGFIADRAGLRPAPFVLGLVVAVAGLALSAFAIRETRDHVSLEHALEDRVARPSWRTVILRTSFFDRSLSAASQAGLVNNLNDGMAWGLLPLFYAAAGLSLTEIATLAAAYPLTWGTSQLATGALSDRIGRKGLGCSCRARRSPQLREPPASCPGSLRASRSGSGPAWSTRRSSPPSPTLPIRPGGVRRSASTGCGATSVSPPVRSSLASSRTASGGIRCSSRAG